MIPNSIFLFLSQLLLVYERILYWKQHYNRLLSYCLGVWLTVLWLTEDLNLVKYVNDVPKVWVKKLSSSDWLQYF